MAHLLDTCFMLLAFGLPVYCVLARRRHAVAVGAVWFWLVLGVAGEVLSALDPARSRLLDGLWWAFGWSLGLLYTGLVAVGRHLLVHVLARVVRRPDR